MTPPFVPGQPVVCVDDSPPHGGGPDKLTTGRIYIVRMCIPTGEMRPDGIKVRCGPAVSVYGVRDYGADRAFWGWRCTRFRPLHGTDIRKLEEKYPEYIIKTNEVDG